MEPCITPELSVKCYSIFRCTGTFSKVSLYFLSSVLLYLFYNFKYGKPERNAIAVFQFWSTAQKALLLAHRFSYTSESQTTAAYGNVRSVTALGKDIDYVNALKYSVHPENDTHSSLSTLKLRYPLKHT